MSDLGSCAHSCFLRALGVGADADLTLAVWGPHTAHFLPSGAQATYCLVAGIVLSFLTQRKVPAAHFLSSAFPLFRNLLF